MTQSDPDAHWFLSLADTVREHCRHRNYALHDTGDARRGYRTFDIEVEGREGHIQLSYNAGVFQLDFPEGFGWTEITPDPVETESRQTLHTVLRLLDAYTDPASRLTSTPRRWRKPRLELRLADGTVLWHHGGQRAQP